VRIASVVGVVLLTRLDQADDPAAMILDRKALDLIVAQVCIELSREVVAPPSAMHRFTRANRHKCLTVLARRGSESH